MKSDILDPSHFIAQISRSPEFQTALPRKNIDTMPPDELGRHRRRAVALGAAAIARHLEQERGNSYDLEANLMSLIAHMNSFYEGQRGVNAYRDRYDDMKLRDIPEKARAHYRMNKQKVTDFNHVLREVINAGAPQFDFNELLVFMTTQHIAMGGRDTQQEFHDMARSSLVGMRNEIAVEQVLIANGVNYELGTAEQDARGGDFIIEDTMIDVKASPRTAEDAKQEAIRYGRNPNLIVWSHINFDDFEGKLTLPARLNQSVGHRLLPDIDKAVASNQYPKRKQA